MIKLFFYIVGIILNLYTNTVLGVQLNAIAFFIDENNQVFSPIINEFNEYSKNHNLNITVNLNFFTSSNFTTFFDYESTVESLLKKNESKYDIYFYDGLYSNIYGPFLHNLKNLFPEDYLNMFDSNILKQTCTYNNEIVGLPLTLGYRVLYSNTLYLEKYNKTIPKTWDQLLSTSKEIIKMEKENYNNTINAYNGLFSDNEEGFCSIYQFLHSFRKTYNSSFPELTSQEAVDALNMLKKMKNEIASDTIFGSDESYAFISLLNENTLFTNFWIYPVISSTFKNIKMSAPPGVNENVSGSSIISFNVGITNKIKPEYLNDTITLFRFMTCKETQKKYLKNFLVFTAILSLYDDPEVCSEIDCELFKSLQPIQRPASKVNDYFEYSKRFRKYLYDFLYRSETSALDALKKIDDMTRIYYVSINPKESLFGFINTIIIVVTILLMFLSLIFPLREKYSSFFDVLPFDFWILTVLGSIFILSSFFAYTESVTSIKCCFNIILIAFGVTLNFIPFLCKLIINFPEENKISNWTYKHRYLFIMLLIAIEITMDVLIVIFPFSVKDVIVNTMDNDEAKNYRICQMNTTIGKALIISLVFYKLIIYIAILILAFIEWHIKTTYYDLKFIVITIYINILSIILLVIFNNIQFKNYLSYNYLNGYLITIGALSNYLFLYGFRIILGFLNKQNTKVQFIAKINRNFIDSTYTKTNKISQLESSNHDESNTAMNEKTMNTVESDNINNVNRANRRYSIMSKIINYHYQVDVSNVKESKLSNQSTNNYL